MSKTTGKRKPGRPSGRGLGSGELQAVIKRRRRWTPGDLAYAAGTSRRSAQESLRMYTVKKLLRRTARGQYERIGS